MPSRRYDGRRRRLAADRTRQRLLEAARGLIGGRGDLQRFSMEAVAARAGVSRMTVYNQFRSRTGLLEAVSDHLAAQGGLHRMPEVFRAESAEEGWQRLVTIFVEFWASDRVTLRRLRAMGVARPVHDAGPRYRDAWRREAIQNLLARHGRAGAGGNGDSLARRLDVLAMLTSFETFDALCTEERSPAEVATLIVACARPWWDGPLPEPARPPMGEPGRQARPSAEGPGGASGRGSPWPGRRSRPPGR